MHELIVYSRPGCHLCDELLAELRTLIPAADVQVVNIDTEPQLRTKYGLMIPVLAVDGDVVCHGQLDRERLMDAMAL